MATANVILIDPKYPHNIGAAVRAASCFGIDRVIWTGTRSKKEIEIAKRVPREERMRGYKEVQLEWAQRIPPELLEFSTLVAIEILPGAIPLPMWTHPVDATYVFGPEDGTIPKAIRHLCHEFVIIPSFHCLNLAASVYLLLYDRVYKAWVDGHPLPALAETRGEIDFIRER